MAHYTLIARINAGDGKFPFVNVQFSKNRRPIPIERATTTSVRALVASARQSGADHRHQLYAARLPKELSH